MELPYAEDIGHYWQTGTSSPEVWMDKTRRVLEDLGGEVIAEGFGSTAGKAAYMMASPDSGAAISLVTRPSGSNK